MSTYAAVYERNWSDEYQSLRAMKDTLEERYRDAIKAEQKKRQPRKRVHFDDLPEDVAQEILEHFKASAAYQVIGYLEQIVEREKANQETLLAAMAPNVTLKPEQCMYRVKVSSSYGYSSQGYGACAYAKGALEPYADHLRGLGFEVYIRQVNYQPGTGQFAVDHCDYELWVNCPEWMFDAAVRRLAMGEAVDSMRRRQINPLVYHPGLGDWARL